MSISKSKSNFATESVQLIHKANMIFDIIFNSAKKCFKIDTKNNAKYSRYVAVTKCRHGVEQIDVNSFHTSNIQLNFVRERSVVFNGYAFAKEKN